MKPWLWMTLCLGCLVVAGCRTNQHRTMLEQESRQWEERFYIVQDQLEECQGMLDASAQCGLEPEGTGGGSGSTGSYGSTGAGKTSAGLTPPSVQGMSDGRFQTSPPDSLKPKPPGGGLDLEEVKPPANSLPVVSPPEQTDPDSDAPSFDPGPAIELPGPQPGAVPGGQKPDMKLPLKLSGDSREVAHVELIGMSSDGFNADGRPGDEGIQFILQPRDRDGRPIAAAGPVSIVVVDPLPAGKSVRVARWDLSTRQTAGYLDRSPQGFHLRLPWPATEPNHPRLRLFARYTTSDGRKIEAEKTIEVNPPGRQAPVREIARLLQRTDPPDSPRVAAQPRQSKPPNHRPSRQRPVWSPERH